MATSDATKRATRKYDQEKIDRVFMRVPKGKKELLQLHAESQGETLNSFLNRAVEETMERDKSKQ